MRDPLLSHWGSPRGLVSIAEHPAMNNDIPGGVACLVVQDAMCSSHNPPEKHAQQVATKATPNGGKFAPAILAGQL